MMMSIAEDQELLNEVSIRSDIRRQVWGEFYDVFGYMLSETTYGELIEEEIERRYKLHCLKEEEVMNKMKDVSQDDTLASTLAVCDENPFSQQMEEDVMAAPHVGPDFDYDAYWDLKMADLINDTQKEAMDEEKNENASTFDRSAFEIYEDLTLDF